MIEVRCRVLLCARGEWQQAISSALYAADYDVTVCGTAGEALAAMNAGLCDLLVVQGDLPGLCDSDLLLEAAALRPGLAIIVLGEGSRIGASSTPHAAAIERIDAAPSELPAAVARVLKRRAMWLDIARLASELADSRRQLEAIRAEFDRFAGRLAHDLQAVLQVTEGFAVALARTADAKLDARECHYLKRIAANSARGNSLVQRVQAYARLGVHPIEQRPVALADALRRARRLVQSLADGREVEWVVDELPLVTGDASLLQQVLVDLLSNALYATSKLPKAVIRIESATTTVGCEIRISDNGADFEPQAAEQLLQLFEPVQGKDGHREGLAHARRIIERHGGSMRAQTTPGAGAIFAFTLPQQPGEHGAQASAASAASAEPASAAWSARPLRVLLVDDDPIVRLSLTNMVELDGHRVDSADSGESAVDAFEHALAQGRGYDAVITDLGMPHMDGSEVARRVKRASPRVRVILLTGWGSGAAGAREASRQVDIVLDKPPRLAQLREALALAQVQSA